MDELPGWCRSISGSENEFTASWLSNNVVLASVLITKCVTSDNNWLSPTWYEPGNIRYDDWLSEDGSIKNVSNGTIWRLPHLFESELLDSVLVWGDGGALDSDLAFLDGFGRVDGHLIVGSISVLHAQIEVFDIKIKIWGDVLFLNPAPDNSGHFITVKIANWVDDLQFRSEGSSGESTSRGFSEHI